jgi:hypothetical protein
MGNGTELATTQAPVERSVPRFLSLVSPNMKRVDPSLRPFAELALQEAESDLLPATRTEFAATLLPSLALVAPTGMTEGDRQEWLKAAWIALDGIPLDLLKRGCRAARFSDHPAKLVPAILTDVSEPWNRRRATRSEITAAIAKMETPSLPQEDRCTPEEARKIRECIGLRFDDDAPPKDYIPVEQRRAPDRQWFIDNYGIDPDAPQADRNPEGGDSEAAPSRSDESGGPAEQDARETTAISVTSTTNPSMEDAA